MSLYTPHRSLQKSTAKSHPLDAAGIPWILRPVTGKIELRLPYSAGNRSWLKTGFDTGKSLRPKLDPRTNVWELSPEHFTLATHRLADRYKEVEVYMQFRETEKCTYSCQTAEQNDCVCCCRGKNHGGGIYPGEGWVEHGEVLIRTGIVQVHSTLYAGHRLSYI